MITDQQARQAIPPTGWCAAYCEWAAYVVDSPVVFHVGSALAAASLMVPTHVAYEMGAPVPGTVWSMLVGTAGRTRKSTAGNMAFRMVREAAPDMCGFTGQESVSQLIIDIEERPHNLSYHSEFGKWMTMTGPRS